METALLTTRRRHSEVNWLYTKERDEPVGRKLLNASGQIVSVFQELGSSSISQESLYPILVWWNSPDAQGVSGSHAVDYLKYDELGVYSVNESDVKIYVWFNSWDICMFFMGDAKAYEKYNS